MNGKFVLVIIHIDILPSSSCSEGDLKIKAKVSYATHTHTLAGGQCLHSTISTCMKVYMYTERHLCTCSSMVLVTGVTLSATHDLLASSIVIQEHAYVTHTHIYT